MPLANPPMTRPERPPLLVAGILLTGLHASLLATLWLVLSAAAIGLSGFAVVSMSPSIVFPVSLAASLGVAVMLALALFYLFVIFVCFRSWSGSRPWLWALIALSAIGLIHTGPISLVINVLAIVGALQWLDTLPKRRAAAPA